MFSTPLICSSIGAITVVATTSALAPGYWPLTLIIGGTISGYCAIGRRMNETPPRMMNTIDSTEAKIGRSMKKREILIAGSIRLRLRPGRPRRRSLLLRRHFGTWPRPHQAVDDDAVVRRDPVLDDAQVADELAERDVSRARNILAIDHEHELAYLLGADRRVGQQQRLIGGRGRHPHAPEHAGR